MIKVSVIVPIYNMELYLSDCLDSILNQTLLDIEILCINDGSTDNSLSIIREYETKDSRIRLFNQENKGVAQSRNRGIKEAKGNYVAFIDPDDLYPDEDVLESLYTVAEDNNVLVSGGCFSNFDNEGNKNQPNDYQNDMLFGYLFEKDEIIKYSEYQFDYGYHRFIYNKKMLIDNNIFFPELVRFQDPPFMVRALSQAERFFSLRKVTYCYRLDHKTVDWNEEKVSALLTGLDMNLKFAAQNKYGSLYKLTLRRILYEYGDVISKQFKLNIENEQSLLKILGELQGEKEIKSLMWFVIQMYQQKHDEKQRSLENEILQIIQKNELEKQCIIEEKEREKQQIIKGTEQDKQKLSDVISDRDNTIEQLVVKLNEAIYYKEKLEKSISYKIGMMITFIPRKIRSITKSIIHKLAK